MPGLGLVVSVTVLVCCVSPVQSIWKQYNVQVEVASERPPPINNTEDWNKHMTREFGYYDLDWNNHSDINKCSRILDTPIPMNSSNRAILTCPTQLAIDHSSIPNAGQGVWSLTTIPRLTVFGPFEGRHVVNTSADHVYGWNLNVVNWKANESIVADDPATSNWMRYVNSARNYAEQNIHNFNIYPDIFWSGDWRHNLTYLNFDCKLCNKSFQSPLLTKYHIHYDHGRNDPAVQNNIEEHIQVRQPDTDLYGDLLKRADLEKQDAYSSVISLENQAKGSKANESSGVSRRKRSIENELQEKEKVTVPKTSKKKGKVTVPKTSKKKGKVTVPKTSKKKTTKRKSYANLQDATNHYTTINITPPYETTTKEIRTIHLEFDSSKNLQEKIKQKLIDAGISVQERNTQGTATTFDFEKFYENCQRSSSGQMEPGEFGEFMNKLKVLKTYGTLNVSKDQEKVAVENYKFDAKVSSSQETFVDSNNTTQVENSFFTPENTTTSLLNATTISIGAETKIRKSITTTQRITPSRKTRIKKTTHPCTCPTYSDYRGMWHNISISSTEREFKMNEPNHMVGVRYRWYNESSEPQYPDVKSSSSEEITTIGSTQTSSKAKSKRTKTNSRITIKHTRRKRISTQNSGTNITRDISTKKKTKKTLKNQTKAK
ncbi:hypothetical protein WDU94_005387 [Cyamophila willieti]